MGKSNLFHFETPRPFAKIIGIGDGTESVLNDIKSLIPQHYYKIFFLST